MSSGPKKLIRLSLSARRGGFSLPELLTTIAVIGIISAIAIESYTGLQASAREGVARDTSALLNRALLHYSQTNAEIADTARPGDTTDELAVLQKLQARDPAIPGSPYIPQNFSGAISSSTLDYRIQWNGRAFEVLAPGTSGAGIKTGGN